MNFIKFKKISKLSYVIFDFLLLLTMFLPTVSIDRYVEYDFTDGYYNEIYQSYQTPISTKITPFQIMSVLFTERQEASIIKKEYNDFKEQLDAKLILGEITQDEYNKQLSKAKITNKYHPLAIHFKLDKTFSRLEGKMFLYALVLVIFYVLIALFLILNILNLSRDKKLISVANVFGGWILSVVYLVFNIYSFTLAISSDNIIEGVTGTIREITTTCLGPKFFAILTMLLLVGYATYVTIFDRLDTKIDKQNKEIPVVVS